MPKKHKSLIDAVGRVNGRKLIATAHSLLTREAHTTVGLIQTKFYSGQSNSSLAVRTGQAWRGWQVKTKGRTVVSIINNVPHADQRKKKVITPKKAKALAVPLDAMKTGGGVARGGPRDDDVMSRLLAPNQKLFMLQRDGKPPLLVGIKKGNKKKLTPFFILLKKVTIPARLKGLDPWVERRGQMISGRVSNTLYKLMLRS